MSVAINVFYRIGGTIDNATATFVNEAAARLIAAITPWAISGVGLYITLYGYLIMLGKIQEPFFDFVIKCAKILIISALALNAGVYLGQVVEAFRGLEEGLTLVFSSAGKSTTIYQTLDASLGKGMEIIRACLEKAKSAGWTEFGTAMDWYANAGLIAISFALAVVLGGIALLISTLMLKLAFALGPLFIICLIWPVTARFFDSWFGFVVHHLLVVALTAAVLTFGIAVYGHEIAKVNLNDAEQSTTLVALELLIIAAILYAVIKGVIAMAAALAGGLSMGALSLSRMAGAASQNLRSAKDAGRIAKQAATSSYERRHFEAYASAGGRGDMNAGDSAPYQPGYRRVMLEQLQRRTGAAGV